MKNQKIIVIIKKSKNYSSFSGKTKKNEEIKNDYFINFTNNIYTKESHFEKNYKRSRQEK